MTSAATHSARGTGGRHVQEQGLILFASVMLVIIGCFNLIYCIAAIANSHVFGRSRGDGRRPMPTHRRWPGRHARCVRLLAAERAAADPVDAADAAHRGRRAAGRRPAFLVWSR
jgi:hypothetical protein